MLSGAHLKNKLQKGDFGETAELLLPSPLRRGQADYKSVRALAALGAYLGMSSLILRM